MNKLSKVAKRVSSSIGGLIRKGAHPGLMERGRTIGTEIRLKDFDLKQHTIYTTYDIQIYTTYNIHMSIEKKTERGAATTLGQEVAQKPDVIINPAVENILTRSSVRVYEKGVEVAPEELELIMRAAMAAPTAVNKQPWQLVVVRDKETMKKLADALPYAKMTASASLAIVVCGDSECFLPGVDNELWVQDLSAVSENILLAAHALGYGGVWTCLYPHFEREEPVRELLDLPKEIVPFCLIPVGKPAHQPHLIDKWSPYRIHYDRW